MTWSAPALEILERTGLGSRQMDIEREALPAIGVRLRRSTSAALGPTASRFGGVPWLPAGTHWPSWQGERLPFLGQINLADVAAYPGAEALPANGLLQFFYLHLRPEEIIYGAPQDAGAWRVRYVPSAELGALEPGLAEENPPLLYPDSAVAFHAELTFPDACPFDASADEVLAYPTFVNEVSKHYAGDSVGWGFQAYGSHRLLGHWLGVQFGDPPAESHASSASLDWWSGDPAPPTGRQDWSLLFQMDYDGEAGFDWAGSGMAYFCIPRADLAAQRFDRVWLTFKAT